MEAAGPCCIRTKPLARPSTCSREPAAGCLLCPIRARSSTPSAMSVRRHGVEGPVPVLDAVRTLMKAGESKKLGCGSQVVGRGCATGVICWHDTRQLSPPDSSRAVAILRISNRLCERTIHQAALRCTKVYRLRTVSVRLAGGLVVTRLARGQFASQSPSPVDLHEKPNTSESAKHALDLALACLPAWS